MIDKVNKKERTKKYYYDQSCNKLINFFKDDVHQQFVDFIKQMNLQNLKTSLNKFWMIK